MKKLKRIFRELAQSQRLARSVDVWALDMRKLDKALKSLPEVSDETSAG